MIADACSLTGWYAGVDQRADFFDAPDSDSGAQFQGPRKTATLDAGPPGALGNWNRAARPQNRSEADKTGFRKVGHEPLTSSNYRTVLLLKNRELAEFGFSQTEFGHRARCALLENKKCCAQLVARGSAADWRRS